MDAMQCKCKCVLVSVCGGTGEGRGVPIRQVDCRFGRLRFLSFITNTRQLQGPPSSLFLACIVGHACSARSSTWLRRLNSGCHPRASSGEGNNFDKNGWSRRFPASGTSSGELEVSFRIGSTPPGLLEMTQKFS